MSIRYARWDMGGVDLIDERSGTVLCALYPLDETGNATGLRRRVEPLAHENVQTPAECTGMAPLLCKLMATPGCVRIGIRTRINPRS